MSIVEIQDLRRIYKTTTGIFRRKKKEIVALDSISMMIESGELFGLLGQLSCLCAGEP